MVKIQIREILPAAFSDIISVIEETWEPTYRTIISEEQIVYMQQEIYAPESLVKQYEAGQRFYGVYENDSIAGFASYSLISDTTYKLNKLYVHPSGQGKGYGQLLIGHIEEVIKSKGGSYLLLNVNKYNQAQHFYQRQGFAITREEDIPIGPYFMNDYVMVKKLT